MGCAADFNLVCADAAGIAQPLPAELGPLPLYLDEDGFYSVLGPPLSHATVKPPMITPLTTLSSSQSP